jgi:hypothetical protein
MEVKELEPREKKAATYNASEANRWMRASPAGTVLSL